MKTKMMLALLTSFLLLGGTAFAFHGGGVAHCDGCHSMHNSADNLRLGSTSAAFLMKGTDPSSTCLNCHAGTPGSYRVLSATGGNLKQGGDYFWVTAAATYDYDTGRGIVTFDPNQNGHNVVALDRGMAADPNNVMAPGGSMMSNTLGCTSCHDPHGQVAGGTAAGAAPISVSGSYGGTPAPDTISGNFRLLGSAGYKNITAPAPIARTNGSSSISGQYGSGMSNWCLSCHPQYSDGTIMHPVNVPVTDAGAGIYDSYVATGNFTGNAATAYDPLVPFERGATVGSALDLADTSGPSGAASQVMCLSCHRAHASAFENALRWDYTTSEFLAESAILAQFSTTVPTTGAYYKDGVSIDIVAEYGAYQRSLCNKCHAKD